MATYRVDWSQKNTRNGWGCSCDSLGYYAVLGLNREEFVRFQDARARRRYKFTSKIVWLKLYAFIVAEHIELIHKTKGLTANDQIVVCPDNPGHFDRIVDFVMEFLKRRNLADIINREQLREGSSNDSLAHDLALGYVRNYYNDIPVVITKKMDLRFDYFDSQIPPKKKQ